MHGPGAGRGPRGSGIIGPSPRRRTRPGLPRRSSVASAPTFDIDRSSPTPLYFQLARAIEGAITGGSLPAGSRLENELVLAQQYGLSRPTEIGRAASRERVEIPVVAVSLKK